MDEPIHQMVDAIVAASEQRTDYLTDAWIHVAAVTVATGLRSVLQAPETFAMLGTPPAPVKRLTSDDRELLIAQTAEAVRLLLTQALQP